MRSRGIKRLSILLTMGAVALLAVGCSNSKNTSENSEEKKEITIGVSPGPYNVLFDDAIKPILEKEGYTIKEVEFSDLLQSNIAINEGSIDFNVAQHTAYLENYNKEKNSDLTPIVHIPTVPAGIFSENNKSLDNVKAGSKVAIPKDPSNAARAFRLLEKAGWIKIKEGADPSTLTLNDIKENTYGIEITEMESSQIPRALKDLDFGVLPGSVVYLANMDPEKSLLSEDVFEKLELVVTVSEKNKDSKWAKAIVDAYKSDEFKAYMEEHNKNNYWYIPKELR